MKLKNDGYGKEMIAGEEIKRFGFREIMFMVIAAGVVSILQYVGFLLFDPSISFIVSLFLIALGLNFVIFVLQRSGAVIIFWVITAFLTLSVNDIGVVGFPKVVVFLLVGAIFELLYLFLKGNIHNIPVDLALGTSISCASLPLFVAYALAPNLASSFPIALLNLVVIAFVTGLAASLMMYILGGFLEGTRMMVKLEAFFFSLNSIKK